MSQLLEYDKTNSLLKRLYFELIWYEIAFNFANCFATNVQHHRFDHRSDQTQNKTIIVFFHLSTNIILLRRKTKSQCSVFKMCYRAAYVVVFQLWLNVLFYYRADIIITSSKSNLFLLIQIHINNNPVFFY